jgi:thiamine-monophosphate kinase
MPLGEFEIITSYFQRTSKRKDVLLGVGDDCAVLSPPLGKTLLVSTDTLNIDEHFFPDTPAYYLGYKSVVVSLSDMAAMGGEPAWLLLSLSLPDVNSNWLENLSQGLFSCLDAFNIALVGGNISKGNLSITTTILGFGEHLLSRNKAQIGDLIYVTGTLGDGGLSLAFLKNEIPREYFDSNESNWLKMRLFKPIPRIHEALAIRGIANAAIDISDGLLIDLRHILDASSVGAILNAKAIPFSNVLKKLPWEQGLNMALTSGDDYELCFTLPPEKVEDLKEIEQKFGYQFSCIGCIEKEPGIKIKGQGGELLSFNKDGYRHF